MVLESCVDYCDKPSSAAFKHLQEDFGSFREENNANYRML